MLGGECRLKERPQYVVLGKSQYDQNWIDGEVEAGVASCGWKRPGKRPPSLDAPSRGSSVQPAPPVKKPGIVKRWLGKARDKVLRRKPGSVVPASPELKTPEPPSPVAPLKPLSNPIIVPPALSAPAVEKSPPSMPEPEDDLIGGKRL